MFFLYFKYIFTFIKRTSVLSFFINRRKLWKIQNNVSWFIGQAEVLCALVVKSWSFYLHNFNLTLAKIILLFHRHYFRISNSQERGNNQNWSSMINYDKVIIIIITISRSSSRNNIVSPTLSFKIFSKLALLLFN